MPKPKHQPTGLISNSLRFAKKISDTGLDLLEQAYLRKVARLEERSEPERIIDGQIRLENQYDQMQTSPTQYQQPQHMLRAHLPLLSKQLLGRHYLKIHMLSNWVSPQLNELVSDYLFEQLNAAVSQWSSTETVLNQTGEKELLALTKDVARSGRISRAFANQNRVLAAVQGGLSGLMGGVGAAFDVPCSLVLALRGIYQTGRAYGFELNGDDQAVVEYVFKQINFTSLAEKQALLALLRSTQGLLVQHDLKQLQRLFGSSNDAEFLRHFLFDEQGQLKWTWLSNHSQFNVLNKLTRISGAGVGALYSLELVEECTQNANIVFAQARQFLIDHPEQQLDPLAAFLAAQHQLQCQRMNHLLELDQGLRQMASAKAEVDVRPIESKDDIQQEVEKTSMKLSGDQNTIASAATVEQIALSSPVDVANIEVDEQAVANSKVLTASSNRRRASVKNTTQEATAAQSTSTKTTSTKNSSTKTTTRKSALSGRKSVTADASSTLAQATATKARPSQAQIEHTTVATSAKTSSRRLKPDAKAESELVEKDTKNNKN